MKESIRNSRKVKKAFVACVLGLAVLSVAFHAAAVPKGANGETCLSSETGVKHDIKGKTHTCDKCVYNKCDGSGKEIKCTKVTHWSNCVASIVKPGGTVMAPVGSLQNAPITPAPPKTSTGVTSARPSVSAGANLQPKSPGGVVRASTQLNCANGKSFEVNTGNKNGSCSVNIVNGKPVSAGCSDVGGSGAGANVNTAEASCATGCGSTSGSGSCKAVN